MAVTATGIRYWPPSGVRPYQYRAHIIDAAGEEFGAVFRVPATGDITKVGVRTGTVTKANALDVGLVTVDADGFPTATAYGGSAVGAIATPASNTWYEVTLATPAAATAGDHAAVRVSYNSFVDGNLQIMSCNTFLAGFPYCALKSGAGPAWAVSSYVPACSILYGTDYYPCGMAPFSALSSTSLAESNHFGLKFTAIAAERVIGLWLGAHSSWTAAHTAYLYDAADNVLGSVVMAANECQAPSSVEPALYYFDTSVTLTAGTTYRVAVKADSASALTMYRGKFNNAVERAEFGGADAACVQTTKTGAGAWSDDTTNLWPFMGLIIDGIDLGSAGATGFPATSQLEGFLQ